MNKSLKMDTNVPTYTSSIPRSLHFATNLELIPSQLPDCSCKVSVFHHSFDVQIFNHNPLWKRARSDDALVDGISSRFFVKVRWYSKSVSPGGGLFRLHSVSDYLTVMKAQHVHYPLVARAFGASIRLLHSSFQPFSFLTCSVAIAL